MAFESSSDEAAGGEVVEGLEVFALSLVAHFDASELAEAGQGPLHHVAEEPQAAAVGVVAPGGQEAEDAQADDQRDHRGGAVGAVAEDAAGLAAGPAARA